MSRYSGIIQHAALFCSFKTVLSKARDFNSFSYQLHIFRTTTDCKRMFVGKIDKPRIFFTENTPQGPKVLMLLSWRPERTKTKSIDLGIKGEIGRRRENTSITESEYKLFENVFVSFEMKLLMCLVKTIHLPLIEV